MREVVAPLLPSLVLWMVLGAAVAACGGGSGGIGAPVAAGIGSSDEELAEFLKETVQAARASPNSGLLRGRLAMAYDANGFLAEALTSYRQAGALAPDDFRWPYLGAHLEARNERYRAALDDLGRAIEIDAEYAPAWLWRGTWLLKLDRPDEASVAFERAATLGAHEEAALGRALVLVGQERHGDAVPLLEPLARDSGHPYIYRTLGYALRNVGRLAEARTALARGRTAEPLAWRDARAAEKASFVRGIGRLSFAQNLLDAGKVVEALDVLAALRAKYPEETCREHSGAPRTARQPRGHVTCALLDTLSTAYARAGRGDEAFALVQRGLSINPEFFPFHLNVASLYRERRELEKALHHIERAIALSPSFGDAHVQRGRLLIGVGRYEEAQAALETALRNEPEQPATLLYLGMAEGALERWSEAINHLERAIRLQPGFALAHVYLARSLGGAGRFDEAWQALGIAETNGAPNYELQATFRRLKELESVR